MNIPGNPSYVSVYSQFPIVSSLLTVFNIYQANTQQTVLKDEHLREVMNKSIFQLSIIPNQITQCMHDLDPSEEKLKYV